MFPLRDDGLPLLVGALIHALHHVFELLQLQPLQVLVLVQGVCQQLLHTVHTEHKQLDSIYLMAVDSCHLCGKE